MNTNRKRYEIDNSVSINNLRTSFNEVLKKLDGLGYNNLCENNYFKSKLLNSGANKIISKWRNLSLGTPALYDGVLIDNNYFKSNYTGVNSNVFAIRNSSVYQELEYNQVERLSSEGVLTISLFYVSPSNDTTNALIKLQRYNGNVLNTWTDVDEGLFLQNTSHNLVKQMPGTIGTDFPNYLFYRMTSKIFNVSSTYFDIDATTEEGKLRMVVNNSSATYYKILVNALSYFGSMDGASFVRNKDDYDSLIKYDETKGEYYLTNDGQDSISLSTGKYFLTVGTRGTYATIEDALESIALDNSSIKNDRIFYLLDTISLTKAIQYYVWPAPEGGNITILGNGNQINTNGYYISLPSNTTIDNVIFNVTGIETPLINHTPAQYITLKNIKFNVESSAPAADTPLIHFVDVSNSQIHISDINYATPNPLTTDFGRRYTLHFRGGKSNDIKIDNINRFGKFEYGTSAWTNSGYAIYLENYISGGININNFQFNNVELKTANYQNSTYTSSLYAVWGESINYNNIYVGHIYASGATPPAGGST